MICVSDFPTVCCSSMPHLEQDATARLQFNAALGRVVAGQLARLHPLSFGLESDFRLCLCRCVSWRSQAAGLPYCSHGQSCWLLLPSTTFSGKPTCFVEAAAAPAEETFWVCLLAREPPKQQKPSCIFMPTYSKRQADKTLCPASFYRLQPENSEGGLEHRKKDGLKP